MPKRNCCALTSGTLVLAMTLPPAEARAAWPWQRLATGTSAKAAVVVPPETPPAPRAMDSQPSRPALQPVSTAGIRTIKPLRKQFIHPDGTTGPWIDLAAQGAGGRGGGGIAGTPPACTPYQIAFDSWEIDPNESALTPVGGTDCGGFPEPDFRYWFGSGYSYPRSVSEFSSPAFAGRDIGRMAMPAQWYVTGTGSSEQCFVLIEINDTFGECGATSIATGSLGIVVFDFGVLASGLWLFDLDFCPDPDDGFTIPFPADGSGAVYTILAKAYGGTIASTVNATAAQPFVWGTQPGGATGSFTTHTQWDDDSPANGVFTPGECYDYAGLIPPCDGNFSPNNMFGLCITMWATTAFCGTIEGRLDCNCDGVIDNFDLEPFLALFGTAGGPFGCSGCAGDADEDGDVDLTDLSVLLMQF